MLLHIYNISFASSNLMSPTSLDVHHSGQVQVWMEIHVLSGFVSSILHLPLFFSLFFYWTGMNAVHIFLSFSEGWRAILRPRLKDFGMMNMSVNDPERWAIQTFFGGSMFGRAHNVEDSYRFELVCMCRWLVMGIGKVEHKSLPCFVFSK